MPRLPVFVETVEYLKVLHERKNDDYASMDSPLFNFEFAAYITASAINHGVPPRYIPYLNHIATKLARLINLLGDGRKPNNESVLDTFNDLAAYSILWKCDYSRSIPPTDRDE